MAGTPQPARIAVFGAGYVGLVTAAGFADLGHLVAVRDVVPEKIEALRGGRVPIYEPGLDELLERNRERLSFTLDVGEAIAGAEFVYVCVDTPPTYSGDADLSRVWTVVDELPQVTWVERPLLVMKSTVPVGTGEKVRHALDARGFRHVGYVANPEFTAEGSAVEDFRKPDRIVIGAFEEADGDRVEALHAEIDAPVVRADVNSAEMVKLASNAFLMTRISFINEIANVCEATGADVVQVARGIGLDHRLGPHFLRAGIGYGGSCLLGHETVLVRQEGRKRLVTLAALYEETEPGARVEILSWRPDGEGAEVLPIELLTRREYDGEVVEVRTKMGRRVRCTPDHVFVTEEGRKLAQELTSADWLPIAQGVRVEERPRPRRLNVLGGFESAGLNANDVIVRPYRRELELIGAREIQETLGPLGHHRGVVARSHDIRRAGALRLVEEVAGFWRSLGVKATVFETPPSKVVRVSSRLLATWWLGAFGLGANCYEQRLPDLVWDESDEHKRALLAGLWLGDGSWSHVSGGPSVVLEYGAVSRELADGMLRLLGELGIVARLKVGRTAKSTVDTYWLVVSGADQVERLLDLVPATQRTAILHSLRRQAKRIAPTGYRRRENAAWVRVTDLVRRRHTGHVYSLEVPPTHTFVTTGGLVVSNCFPKDSLALKQLASNSGYHFQLLNAVIEVNELQKRRVIGKLKKHLGSLRGTTVALLGLAFKPFTDDVREAPSIVLASRLLAEGAEVRAWDPVARPRELLQSATFCETPLEAVTGADAAVIVTEWPELRDLITPETRAAMRRPVVVDGRNLLDPAEVRAAGFAYEGVGRPSSPFGALAA